MIQQQHLSDVVERYGTGDGTADVVALVERGLYAANAARQAERIAAGKAEKVNPYVTDSERCARAIQFSLRNVPESDPPTVDSLVNFGVGSATEEWLATVIGAQGLDVLREVRVELQAGETVVSGRIDFLFVAAGRLIELKSTSSRNMGFMLRGKCGSCGNPWPHDKDSNPKPSCMNWKKQGCGASIAAWVKGNGKSDHRAQANLYLHASQIGALIVDDKPVAAIDVAYLVYVVKDATRGEPPIHAFKVEYDAAQAQTHLDRLSRVAATQEDISIPAGYEWKAYPCSYCSWREVCGI